MTADDRGEEGFLPPAIIEHQPSAPARQWPNGRPGNRRRGAVRGTRAGTRRGTLPKERDPVILKRKEIAARLWGQSKSGAEILAEVNAWLIEHDERPVGMKTIYKDHQDILADYRRASEASIEDARSTHLARLDAVSVAAWKEYYESQDSRARAALLNGLRQLELSKGKFDGSLSPTGSSVSVTVPILQIEELNMDVFSNQELEDIIRRARGQEAL